MEEFEKLGLSKNTLDALKKKGFTKPTPIQEKTIPLLMKGDQDVVGQAQTGTGKTACFALPIIEKIKEHSKHIQAIVLCPTRELAIQVAKETESLTGNKHIKVLTVYGGASIQDQVRKLNKGIDVVVGTPGRVMDLINRKKLDISKISFAVLDEADEMLNMGFVDDMKEILGYAPKEKKMLMFSATMPDEILKIAKQFMNNFELIKTKSKELTIDLTEQIYYSVKANARYDVLKRVIDSTVNFHGIVFCKTKATVDNIAHKMVEANYNAAALHGDITQSQREKIINLFSKKKIDVLIATDVAARGIDVNDLTHVINFSLPQSPEIYVHRIGRTGRAGKKGIAITFLIPSEQRRLKYVEKIIKKNIERRDIPTVQEVIDIKKDDIAKTLHEIITPHVSKSLKKLAKSLLEENDPELVVSSFLKHMFEKELDESQYNDVSSPSQSDRRGNDRRGRGRRDRRSNSDSRRSRDGHRRRDSDKQRRSSRPSGSFDKSDRKPRDSDRSRDRKKSSGSFNKSDRKPRRDSDKQRRSSRPSGSFDKSDRKPRDSDRSRDRKKSSGSFNKSDRKPRRDSDRSRDRKKPSRDTGKSRSSGSSRDKKRSRDRR